MIDFYYWPTPNGHKIAIAMEEMELPYRTIPVNILRGEQMAPEFLAISPNNRIPAIVDPEGPGGAPHAVFESGAILLYLAEKRGRFWPSDPADRSTMLQWLFFQAANVGPMFGQCGHFRGYAPEQIDYGINRYCGETRRLYGLMDRTLAQRPYLAGADYGLADMATYPWCAPVIRDLHGIDIAEFSQVAGWTERIEARPAVRRGMALLADAMKIGNPDAEARQSLFGGPGGAGKDPS